MADSPMELLGKDLLGQPVYRADERFEEPGIYLWDEDLKRNLKIIPLAKKPQTGEPATVEFAREELKRVGLFDGDSDYNGALGQCVLQTVKAFMSYGHSGHSAEMGLELFNRLIKGESL